MRASLAAAARTALGTVLGCVVWLWVRSLSVVVESATTAPRSGRVMAFLHGQQMALLAVRRTTPAAVLVSHSSDGDIQSAVMRVLGFEVVRGSSSRGGARGLVSIVRFVRRGLDAAFAVDGPRGPAGIPKPGAALTARRAEVALIPVASAARRKFVLGGTWDSFEIPWPFSRVAVVFADPLESQDVAHASSRLAVALAEARARAEHLVTRRPALLAAPEPR